MLTHPTLDQLRALKLDGIADAFIELEQQDAAKDLTHAEWLALLLGREIANRTTKRRQIRLRARLRYARPRSRTSTTARNGSSAKRSSSSRLAAGLPTNAMSSALPEKCSLGKTWLACALAERACREG